MSMQSHGPTTKSPYRQRIVLLILCGALIVAGLLLYYPRVDSLPQRENSQALSVAAASDLRFTLDQLVDAFKAERPGLDVRVTYASSGSLHAQILNQAPFDIF